MGVTRRNGPRVVGEVSLTRAERLCRERGARLTAQRRRVLEIVLRSPRPLGAYEILHMLETQADRRMAPPTVYRALEFLLEQGFIHRVASLQAYMACVDPDHPHAAQLLVCRECGRVEELEDGRLDSSVQAAAQARGFVSGRHAVEVTSTCRTCEPA